MASVGTHIKRLRGAKHMTQEELAAQLHVTRQAVSAWETGKALPDVEMLERIAAALGSDVTEVIYGAKSAPDLTALKRKWVRQGIGWGLWLAIGYYILFCCGVWGSWTRGLSYQFSARNYRVEEEVLPGSWSVDADLREAYRSAEPVIYEDGIGCRIRLCQLDWDEERNLEPLVPGGGCDPLFCPMEGNAGDGLYERLSGFPVLPYRQNCRPYHHGEGGTAYCRADWEQCSGQR